LTAGDGTPFNGSVNVPLVVAGLCLVLTGCSSLNPAPAAKPGEPAATAKPPAHPQAAPATPADPVPVNVQQGRIASVRSELKFVVVDFTPGVLPQIGRRMSVYRGGQKVAELLISGPAEGLNIAADVIEGVAQEGDTVR